MFVKPPYLLRIIYPSFIWRFSVTDQKLFLTFDDGPIPELTPWVLETLKKYKAKATFFCVGENVIKHPNIYNQIISEGHVVGNHTFNHLNGWKTKTDTYLDNVDKCSKVVSSNLFRPPYGRLTRKQIKSSLLQKDYKLIMWDVLSFDYDQKISPERCLQNVIKQTKKGSIILFHDNLKAQKNLKYVLPQVLDYFTKQNYTFESINLI